MLVDEAASIDGTEHERLMAKAETGGIGPTFTADDDGAG